MGEAAILANGALSQSTAPDSLTFRIDPPASLIMDSGATLTPLDHRLSDLWRAQRRALERAARLPCADRRPACREPPSGDRPARLVGDHGRSGPAVRHRPLLRHLIECARRLHGHHRPRVDQPGYRRPVRARLSHRHHRRHGARARPAPRSPRDRAALLRRRRLDGRHAGSGMGGALSGPRLRRAADRDLGPPLVAEHRLP